MGRVLVRPGITIRWGGCGKRWVYLTGVKMNLKLNGASTLIHLSRVLRYNERTGGPGRALHFLVSKVRQRKTRGVKNIR